MRGLPIGLLVMMVVGAGLIPAYGSPAAAQPPADPGSAPSEAGLLADFDGDGSRDLAVGVPNEDGTFTDTGGVHVLYGSSGGLTGRGSQFWNQNSPGVADEAEERDSFGWSIAVGDFNGDRFSDLAVGVPFEDVGDVADAGAVHILYGSPNGLTGTGSTLWTQNTAGIAGDAEPDDRFGWTLAAANLGRSGQADLAIGVPFEDMPTAEEVGGVHVLFGSTNGLIATGSQFWTQDNTGIADADEAFDTFGFSLTTANFGNSTHADLAVGVPFEDVGGLQDAGAVQVLYGSATGLTSSGSQFWTQNSAGVFGGAEVGDGFGWTLAAANFGKSAHADLVVDVPFEGTPEALNAGGVHVLYGSATGLTGSGSQFWNQNTAGIFGAGETNDRFGLSLAAANFGRSSHADLAIGVPYEGTPDQVDIGGVHVLYGSANGLTAAGSQYWTQNSAGIFGRSERLDRFGRSLAAANFGRSSYADLAVGVPEEDAGSSPDAGGVHILYGSANGLASTGSQFWNQNSTGIFGSMEPYDQFGSALATGSF